MSDRDALQKKNEDAEAESDEVEAHSLQKGTTRGASDDDGGDDVEAHVLQK